MPALTYTSSNFPFQPFSKIFSADTNSMFTDIRTLLNTTGLDDTNIQTAGLSITKLKVGTGTAGQFVSNNGATVVWSNNPLSSQYNYILGSAAQVTAGTATNSTLASITFADGDRVLVLPGYATSENLTIAKKVFLTGLGPTSQISGNIALNSGASYTVIQNVRCTGTVTVASGVNDSSITNFWSNQASSSALWSDSGTGTYFQGWLE